MNNFSSFQSAISLLGLAAIASLSSSLPVIAQTTENTHPTGQNQLIDPDYSFNTPEAVTGESETTPASNLTKNQVVAKNQPLPGTTETSASVLLNQPTASQTPANSTRRRGQGQEVAQEVEPGRATRSGSSYIGIGGNIGLTGDSGLGDSGFAVFSKIGLTRNFSVRPSAIFSNDTDFIIPVTFDFPVQAQPFQRINFAPYVGAGVLISTDGDNNIGLALTGGVDVPISNQFTATAGLTAGFSDNTNLGIMVGIGYNFGPGFRFD